MPDLRTSFTGADRIPAPDLWDDIERREREPLHPEPSRSRRLAVILLALGVAAAGLALAVRAIKRPGGRRVSSTTANGRIAFSAVAGGTWQIFSVEPDGSGLSQLTHVSDGIAESPVWSPDGTRIAYQVVENRGTANGPTKIWVMNADGTDQRQLIRGPGSYWSPAWSPDGTQIAYAHQGGVFTANPDGTDVTQVTHDIDGAYPSWSPDGTTIAFGEGGEVQHLYVVNADGTDQTTLVDRPGTWQNFPAWSPDGSTIAFAASNREGSGFGLYAVNPDGTGLRKLTDQPAAQSPAWSPDGRRIVFMAPRAGTSEDTTLYVMNADGTEVRELPDLPKGASSPSWQTVATQPPASPSATLTMSASPPAVGPSVTARVTETISVGPKGQTNAIAYAFDSVWVSTYAASHGGAIVRLDPETGKVTAKVAINAPPTWEIGGGGLSAGDGSIWVAGLGTTRGDKPRDEGVLTRIDPATNQVVAEVGLGGGSAADVAVDDTGVWVLLYRDDGGMQIDRIDPATNRVVATIPLDSWYGHFIFSVDGRIITQTNAGFSSGHAETPKGVLNIIDPASNTETATVPVGPSAWPAAGDGELWLAVGTAFERIDPASGQIENTYSVANTGDAFAVGEEGLWFLAPENRAAIHRFNPTTGSVDVSVDVPRTTPIAMVVSPSAVWVLDYEGTVTKIALDSTNVGW